MHCLLGGVAVLLSVPPGSTGRGNVGVVAEMGKTDFSKRTNMNKILNATNQRLPNMKIYGG